MADAPTDIDPRRLNPLDPLPYPADQRYEVTHDALGPWKRGEVLQADTDLAGANLHALLAGGHVIPTDKPRAVAGEAK